MNKMEGRLDNLFRKLDIEKRKKTFNYLTLKSKVVSDKEKYSIYKQLDKIINSTPPDQRLLFNQFTFNSLKKMAMSDIETNSVIRGVLLFDNLKLRLLLSIYRHLELYRNCLLASKTLSNNLSDNEWKGFMQFVDDTFKKLNKDRSKGDAIIDPIRMHLLMKKFSAQDLKKIEKIDGRSDLKSLELLKQQDFVEDADTNSIIKLVMLLDYYLVSIGREELFQSDIASEFKSVVDDEKEIKTDIVEYLKLLVDCNKKIIMIVEEDAFPFLATAEILDKFFVDAVDGLSDAIKNDPDWEDVQETNKFMQDF